MTQLVNPPSDRVLALPVAPSHLDRRLTGGAGRDRLLELAQPRARREPERREAILVDLEVRFLFDRVRDAGNVVIDEAAADAEGRFLMEHVIRQLERSAWFPLELLPARKAGALPSAVHPDLAYVDNELGLVAVHDVPGIRAQLVLDLRDEARPTEQQQARLAPEHHAQEVIEAGEVVHVGVGDENMREAHQLSRWQD